MTKEAALKKPPDETTAIATRQDRQSGTGLQITPFYPRTIADAMRFAKMLAKSKLVPKALQKQPSDVLVVLMAGQEFRLTPMKALQNLHVIEGRVFAAAQLLQGMAAKHPECEYFRLVESSEVKATFETLRRGYPSPSRMTYTLVEAEQAGLTTKDNWRKYPAAMLRNRAAAHLARAVYPDTCAGLYDIDEAPMIDVTASAEVIDVEPEPAEGPPSDLDSVADKLEQERPDEPPEAAQAPALITEAQANEIKTLFSELEWSARDQKTVLGEFGVSDVAMIDVDQFEELKAKIENA